MEKENKKKRDAAKKKYNEIVRVGHNNPPVASCNYYKHLTGARGICAEER